MESEFVLRPKIRYESRPEEFGENLSERVNCALELAIEIHKDDKRKVSGEPYVYHVVAVASILSSWGADEDEVIGGLLHDTLEDHPDLINIEMILELFGERVARLVDGATKLKNAEGSGDEFASLRKITNLTIIEPGVALIKLADRLHNMLEQEGMKPESQKKNSAETLRFHAPLAESFGLWQVKNILEDLSFQYVEPAKYWQVRRAIDSDPRLNAEFIFRTQQEIKTELSKYGIDAIVEHQVGGYWEIMNKQKKLAMKANTWSSNFSAITDVISFRVLVDSEDLSNCYKAMGVIRMKYGNLIEKRRHDDYLGVPAVNGYSALHDTYKFDEGNVEMCFTTIKKENFNSWGVASINKIDLLQNPEKYVRKLIFTPKKELVFMKPTDTGIDVAYKLNPLLGLRAVGIKIDGQLMSLDVVVPFGSSVEIVVDIQQTVPDAHWLSFCNNETRKMMERQLALSEKEVEVQKGKTILIEKVLSERGVLNLGDLDTQLIDRLLMSLGCWDGLSDLYYKVAYGFDLELIKNKLDEVGVLIGMYTTVLITGENKIGISKDVMSVISKNGGDVRSNSEKVDDKNSFIIRVLIRVDYKGKKRIEEELKKRYAACLVV